MQFDAKIRSIFVLDEKTIAFFRGRRQPNLIKNGKKIKLPEWRHWKVASTIFVPNKNEIRRIRELKLSKKTSIQVVTKEKYLESEEKPFVFRLEKKH
ncbi:MAG: hypothetical protein ACP5GL_08470 [Infirmifilum sp.]